MVSEAAALTAASEDYHVRFESLEQASPRRKPAGDGVPACRERAGTMHPTAVGFHWAPSDKKRHPDAWCSNCDRALTSAGEEWTPALIERAGFGTLCPSHYDFLKLSTQPGVKILSFRLP